MIPSLSLECMCRMKIVYIFLHIVLFFVDMMERIPTTICPDNSTWNTQSTETSNCIYNAGWTGLSGDLFTVCGVGTYKPSTGSGVCSNCPINSISLSGSSSLTDCMCSAWWAGASDSLCTECSRGRYKTDVGSVSCILCPQGSEALVN